MTEYFLLNNRYKLEKLLGKGGMARVYRGRDLMLERTVAIKVLREDYSIDPSFRERFRQEAKASASLAHPNIVTVYDFGLDENRLFIVMEFVPGTNLNTMIKENYRFNIDEGVQIIIQACAGIGFAHRSGLVHCDVKPHNFLVRNDMRLKVTDFGIARALASIPTDEESEIVWGSPQYFSPEQAAGGAPSPSSDVYSLGVVMYQMFTGQLPFIAKTSQELGKLHRFGKPIDPQELNPFISPELEKIILKVLSKEPSARYRTGDQLGRVLSTFVSKEPAKSTKPPSEKPPTRKTDLPKPQVRPARSQKISEPVLKEEAEEVEIDWVAILLSILALVSVGGLIPFWMYVYLVFNPPIP
jgi:serine/threonine-protein kinase